MKSWPSDKKLIAFTTVCLVVVAGTLAGTATVSAQENLDVGLDVPQEATAGEQIALSSTVSLPELPRNHEKGVTVTFYSNGQQIGTETVTVADGETTEIEMRHTFEDTGETAIEVEATVSLADQEYTGSDTATLNVAAAQERVSIDGGLSLSVDAPDSPQVGEETTTTVASDMPSFTGDQEGKLTLRLLVDGEETASKTVAVAGDETTETDFTTVFDDSGETTVTVEATLIVGEQRLTGRTSRTVSVSEAAPASTTIEGAAFAVPESLEDEVTDYREETPRELNAHAFVLATQDELYIVFTQQAPTKGVASVSGPVLERDLTTENLTYGVIPSTNASFETTGTEVGVQDVSDNSEQYRLELVRIDSHYRRVSTVTDPDGGENVTLSTTSGVLVEHPQTAASLFQNAGSDARELSRNTSANQVDAILNDPRGPHLHTVSFETKFWADSAATVDAVVLGPQSAARRFIDEYDRAGVAHAEDGDPILYVVEEDFHPQQMENVERVKSQSLDGAVVETEVRLSQEQISVQETLEHNTGCDADLLEIRTPQGSGCVNVAQDSLLNGGVAWNSVPTSRDGVLLVMGISSRHQDSPAAFEEGRYRIEGEVVSTSRIDESLPDGTVLVIYDMERLGSIDYRAMSEGARGVIDARTDELTARLRQQVGAAGVEIETGRTTATVQSVSPGEQATVSFSQPARGSVSIQQARMNVSAQIQNATVDVAGVSSLPSGVSRPPGQSLRILNISSSAEDSSISHASFRLRISTAAIPDGAELLVSRYHDGEWTALETAVVERNDSAVIVAVETPGFSYFSVGTRTADGSSSENNAQTGGSEAGGESEPETTGASGPGFTALSVAVALLVFVGRRRRGDT